MVNKQIFISIVSFCDTELLPTIASALEQAQYPENITLSIVEQDTDSNQQKIEAIVAAFNAKLIYQYYSVEQTQGVVWARSKAASKLSTEYDYYLQVDSHMRFSMHYDSFLSSTYDHAKNYWGSFVWTAYCPGYKITDDGDILDDTQLQATFAIVDNNFPSKLVGCIKPMSNSSIYGEESFQISGHFLFGDSSIFINHPFDPYLYWEGEESTYAARLYCSNIKTVSPPRIYLWHKYESDEDSSPTRKRHSEKEYWVNQKFMNEKIARLSERGLARCESFWNNSLEKPYGVESSEKIYEFLNLPNRALPAEYATIGYGIEEKSVVG